MKTKSLIDNKSEKHPPEAKRSDKWPTARKDYLKDHPNCAVCGGDKKLEVHHKRPFHIHPELELDPNNFITLCENDKNGVNCHLLVGHLGNFKSVNLSVETDAAEWKKKIINRPSDAGQIC